VSIYILHSQKISNALSTSRQYCAKKCLQLTPKMLRVLDHEDCLAAISVYTNMITDRFARARPTSSSTGRHKWLSYNLI